MFRLVIAACFLLAPAKSSFGQEYEEKSKDQRKRAGAVTVVNGTASIKKDVGVYEIGLSIDVSRNGRNQTGQGLVVLILLEDKGEPISRVGDLCFTVKSSGATTGASGGASVSFNIPAKTFEAASGYAMIVRSEGRRDDNRPELKEFLNDNYPFWHEVVDAFQELKTGDASESVGPVVIRRLK